MINFVIPMAGLGSRFQKAGYSVAKPFIPLGNKPMVQRVMENLALDNCRFILITREDLLENHSQDLNRLKSLFDCQVVTVAQPTEGAACTVLHARKYIQNDDPMIIANSDQIIDVSMENFIRDAEERDLDGSILTFQDVSMNPKWSFAKIAESGLVTEVKEKVPISQFATVGIYHFKRGHYFVNSAIDMIVRNERVNGEFYVCPVYNQLIAEDCRVGIFNIEQHEMHGIGTPEDLNAFLDLGRF